MEMNLMPDNQTTGPLTAIMPNTIAWRLGEVCTDAASPEQKVGDPIDPCLSGFHP
jgi:hypothetical protein